jgi:hypothetical protein
MYINIYTYAYILRSSHADVSEKKMKEDRMASRKAGAKGRTNEGRKANTSNERTEGSSANRTGKNRSVESSQVIDRRTSNEWVDVWDRYSPDR